MKLRTGDLLFKLISFLLIPFVILGSLIMCIGSLIKALGLFLMLDPVDARREIDAIIRVARRNRF